MPESSIRKAQADQFTHDALSAMATMGRVILAPQGQSLLRTLQQRCAGLLMVAAQHEMVAYAFRRAGRSAEAGPYRQKAERIRRTIPRFHRFWLGRILKGLTK